jgi:hypothetical protein
MGVVLFILVIGKFPFSCAKKDEYYFKMIYKNDWESYWRVLRENIRTFPKISDEFKDLI